MVPSPASKFKQEKSLSPFHRILFKAIAGVCMLAATTVTASDLPDTEESIAAQRKYNASVIDVLVADGTPRALVLAATAMSYGGETSRAGVDGQRELLLGRAVQMAPDDALVQWLAAVYALPANTLSEPATALQRIEPDNGAVWLFQLAAASRAKDSTGVTEALARIGASRRFDNHYVDYSLAWLAMSPESTLPEPNAHNDEQGTAPLPLFMAIARAAALVLPNYVIPIQACKSVDQPLATDRREACIAAGRLMLNESSTLISMRIGAALLRLAGAEDADEINRNTEYFVQEYTLLSSTALEDPEEIARFQADWLQTHNELTVAKNMLARAGIPILPPANWESDSKSTMARIARPKDG